MIPLRQFFIGFALLALVLAPAAQQPSCPSSPTGRNPRLLWTCQQQAVWNRMREDNHPWFEKIRADADKDNTNDPRYGSFGRWAMLAYQITGDRGYAVKALEQYKKSLSKNFAAPLTSNALREYFIESVVMYDWIAPGLSNVDRSAFLDYLIRTAENAIKTGVRTYDSDQTTGVYFGFALLDQVAGTSFLTRPIVDTGVTKNVGGLTATAADRSTLRNAIRHYYEVMGEGGECPESSEYCDGTVGLALTGAYAIQTLTGVDHFPEITAFRQAAVRHEMHSFTPDLQDTFQWGELQNPNVIRWLAHEDQLSYLGGLTNSPEMRQFEEDAALANRRQLGTSAFYPRYFYFANPYAPKRPWQQFAGLFHIALGSGHVYARTGWTPDDRALHIRFSTASKGTVDHFPLDHGSFRLWRRGQWVINRPLGYTNEPRLGNQVLIMNQGPSWEATALIGSAFVPGRVAYTAGTTAGVGPNVTPGYYSPPPTYPHENTRSVLYLLDGPDDVIVLADRVHAEDPRTQLMPDGTAAVARYSAVVQLRMNRSLGVKDWLLHTPVVPTFGADKKSYRWNVGETQVIVRQVLPLAPPTFTVIDEKKDTLSGTIADTQKKFAVHAVPAVIRNFDLIIYVITATEGDSVVISEPLDLGDMQGVRIRRPGNTEVVALFSAKPSPKLTTTAVNNRAVHDPTKVDLVNRARLIIDPPPLTVAPGTTVYLADLAPSVAQVMVNGQLLGIDQVGELAVVRLSAPARPAAIPRTPHSIRILK